MSVLGWILAGLLAAVFFAAGMNKLVSSRAKLLANSNMAWAHDFADPQIKAIGSVEVLGAIGLVLPWLLNIAPVLTPIAAIGCAAVMLGAIVVHLRRKEQKALPAPVLFLIIAIVVAAIRFSQL